MFKCFTILPLLALLANPSQAFAQDKPAGLLAPKAATTGKTEVAKEGFAAPTVPAPAVEASATELSVSAGGLFASGNSRSISATAAGQLRVRRDVHQLSVAAAANYGRSAPPAATPGAADAPMQTTIENYQGYVRYDWFVADHLALFLAVSGRRDPFQSLDVRFNVSPGLAYYFIDAPKQRLWAEVGYDLQHDVRTAKALAATPNLDKTQTRHNARLFVGYANNINDAVAFRTGAEYLLSVSPFKDESNGRVNWRLSWDTGIDAHISERFSLGTSLTVRYDNNPLPMVNRTDTLTSVSVTYSLL
jgi:putative salt-induced outer membrane protein